MFYVHEATETYEGGFENLEGVTSVGFATYEEALEAFEESVAAHIEAGHKQIYKEETAACFALFNGGKYAVASYNIFVR